MTARVAFFGTPQVAVSSLDALWVAPEFDLVAVVTNPDRPQGRSSKLVASPVKQRALEIDVPVLQPLKPADILDELHQLQLDAVAVVAYGSILPAEVLSVPAKGFVNLHFSLLPRWRGAAPVQAAILAGDAATGVSCFVLDEGMDTGPLLRQATTMIGPGETQGQLLDRLAELGAPVLVDALAALLAGESPEPQPVDGVTLAPKVRPGDVRIDFGRPAVEVERLVRSANPTPGAHTTFRSKRLKVWSVRPATGSGEPGTVVARDEGGVVVACGEGTALLLREVQPEGKSKINGPAFANGYQPSIGDRFGE